MGVVNVPFTWPAPDVDGFAIAGMDAWARDDGMAYPAALIAELHERFGPLLTRPHVPARPPTTRSTSTMCARSASSGSSSSRRSPNGMTPELLFVVFMSADHVHHLGWPDWEERGRASIVADVYRILDGALGDLLRRVGDDGNVLVVSDHGGGSLEGVVNLNAWLEREG